MHPILKNILGLLAGLLIGGIVNMSIIKLSVFLVSPPDGHDLQTLEGIQTAIPYMNWKHFMMPFLAHAIGTGVGAYFAARIAATYKLVFAMVIGVLFLFGGIAMVLSLPEAPTWFKILDLGLAYIPMAWLGWKVATAKRLP